MYGLSESRKVSDAQRKHFRGYSKFTLPYREPNGSLLGFQNGIMKHCKLYPQHIHMDNNISSNGYMRGRYFKTILILIVMYMQVMQAMLILAKSITGHIRFMISGDPSYGKAEYKHMCSIYGYAYRSSIIMITDPPGDRHTLNIVILARNLLVKQRFFLVLQNLCMFLQKNNLQTE